MTKNNKRIDNRGRILKTGEYVRPNGIYEYKWTDCNGKRNSIYSSNLNDLRQKQELIIRDKCDGIRDDAKKLVLQDIYEIWIRLKKYEVQDTTLQNHAFYYNHFIKDKFGNTKIIDIRKSQIRDFYNGLIEHRGIKLNTLDGIQSTLSSILRVCVEDGYLRVNPASDALRQIKQSRILRSEKRKALTLKQQITFYNYLNNSSKYSRWKNIFTIFMFTGLRCGELTALNFSDIDFEKNIINVDKNLVYYSHADNKCYYGMNNTKTVCSVRTVPMVDKVRQAFIDEMEYVKLTGLKSKMVVGGYSDFIFVTKEQTVFNNQSLNRALKRIMRDCNNEIFDKNPNATEDDFLPSNLSTHILRHSCITRMYEARLQLLYMKQYVGHKFNKDDVTLDVYCDVFEDFQNEELAKFNEYINDRICSCTT